MSGTGQPERSETPEARHWVRTALLLAIVLVLAGMEHAGNAAWETYAWRASSAASGYPKSGTLADHGLGGLLLRTEHEQNPWIVVDMQSERYVQRVVVQNPTACCSDQGLLLVEVGTDGESFSPVGRRTAAFDTWTVDFPPSRARYVRLRAKANTSLRFRELQIQ